MSKAGSRKALLTSAMIVAGIRLWLQVRGKTKTPFPEWVMGWGATFFFLSLLSEASPQTAGGLSLVIVTSDFLANGVGLTTDLSSIVTGAEKGKVFTDNPFGATPPTPAKPGRPGHPVHSPHHPPGPVPFPGLPAH